MCVEVKVVGNFDNSNRMLTILFLKQNNNWRSEERNNFPMLEPHSNEIFAKGLETRDLFRINMVI